MSDELKPCKRCGGKAVRVIDDSEHEYDWDWFVQCRTCYERTGAYDSIDKAVAAWNARADDAPEQTVDNQADSRERLEADVHSAIFQWGWDSEWSRNEQRINECVVRSWLNRQAAITERECREQPCNNISCSIALGNQNLIAENRELHKQVDSLTAERDELRDIIAHMPKTEQECEACQEAHDRLMFNAKVDMDKLRDELTEKQLVIDRQRDSFLKLERENRELQDVCGELERTLENLRGVE